MTQSARTVIIVGATSTIAEAVARLYASEGGTLLLVGRNEERLVRIAADLRLRGAAGVDVAAIDLVTADAPEEITAFAARLGHVDHILIAFGVMPDQDTAARSPGIMEQAIAVNLVATARWTLASADLLERQGRGSVIVLGSPAGDRGRRRNFIYGMSKSGLVTLVEGIAHRFAGRGPRAVIVKPGPTLTAMTAHDPQPTMATPAEVAIGIRRAADAGPPVQYVPRKWGWIMRVVRAIPTALFNRLDF
jgi:decaprenylphospho-beta-D-erythro-pentofuranosid-2-ulose 2-reductase